MFVHFELVLEKHDSTSENIHISPNPFTESTIIELSPKRQAYVKIELFDDMGQHIKNIANYISIADSYKHEINFKQMGLKPGMYFVSIAIDGTVNNTKLIYTK